MIGFRKKIRRNYWKPKNSKEEEQRIDEALRNLEVKLLKADENIKKKQPLSPEKISPYSERVKSSLKKMERSWEEKEEEIMNRTVAKVQNAEKNRQKRYGNRSANQSIDLSNRLQTAKLNMTQIEKMDTIKRLAILQKAQHKERAVKEFKESMFEDIRQRKEIQKLHRLDIEENLEREKKAMQMYKTQLIMKFNEKTQKAERLKSTFLGSPSNNTFNKTYTNGAILF